MLAIAAIVSLDDQSAKTPVRMSLPSLLTRGPKCRCGH